MSSQPAVHVATVHFRSPKWIDVQLRYLAENIHLPLRTYGCLNGIDPAYNEKFTYAADLDGTHAEKLNALAGTISAAAAPGDILMFIDGDAFPIAPLDEWMIATLARYPLAAVRRDENLGDRQPHPSFCITTPEQWNRIGGDWRPGYTWRNSKGEEVTDVGGNLLGKLEAAGIEWLPILRSNTRNPHPIFFGVYGGLVYHHGAGFRMPLSRGDGNLRLGGLLGIARSADGKPMGRVRRKVTKPLRKMVGGRAREQNVALSDRLFTAIQTDPHFADRLTS